MANRRQRRKQGDTTKKIILSNDNDRSEPNLIKVGIIVVIIIGLFYFLTVWLTNHVDLSKDKSNNNNTSTPAVIQYDKILAGEIFNMNDSTYYVLCYDSSDSSAEIYGTLVSKYKTNHSDGILYTVDLASGFNKPYVSDSSNPNASKADELKIKGPTLIKIQNGINTSYVEGLEAISAILKA